MLRVLIMLAICACGSQKPTPERPPKDSDTSVSIPASGPIALPHAWIECTTDADCTITALGCCDETPVNRASYAQARDALRASGRRYCPVKAACGPGTDGTKELMPGRCLDAACTMPSWP
jgi:hypothetical protein